MGGPHGTTLAWALSWDGARCSIDLVAPVARAFLSKSQWHVLLDPETRTTDHALEGNLIQEVRIAWVPELRGGAAICSERELIRRIAFRLIWRRTIRGYVFTVYRPLKGNVT